MALDSKAVALPLINALRRALERMSVVIADRDVFAQFMSSFGWTVSLNETQLALVREWMGVEAPLAVLGGLAQELEGGGNEAEIIAQMVAGVLAIVAQIKQWSAGVTGLPAPFDDPGFWIDFPEDLMGQLMTLGLREEAPGLQVILALFGILETKVVTPAGPGRNAYVRARMRWDRLGALATDPVAALKQSLGWGVSGQSLDHEKLLGTLDDLAQAVGLPGRLSLPSDAFLDLYYAVDNSVRNQIRELNLPFILQVGADFATYAELGLKVMPIPAAGDAGGPPVGIVVAPLVHGAVQASPAGSGWSLALTADAILDGAFRFEIRPTGANLELSAGAGELDVGLSLRGRFDSPAVLIGAAGSHRVELEGAFVAVEMKGRPGSPEIIVRAGTGDGPNPPRLRFVFQAGEGDGFIKGIIGDAPQAIDLAGHFSFSNKAGLGVNGSAGLQMLFPLHLSLGPIEFQALKLGVSASTGGGLSVPLGLDVKAALGPLVVVVSDVGAKLKLKPTPGGQPGLLGNLDLEWGFQPPRGAGLALDAGVVKGGGYLFFDPDHGEYAGALELEFADFLALKAIGLITTRMPDGSSGFSLLIVITAEFPGGLQLGYGFTLLGVGGLLGLNRTMRLDALAEGVRTGAIESVMFPRDVIANAPRILSDLKAFFPQQSGTFLIGPMAKIGWGTPTLISIAVGIIIEIPGNIAMVGVIKVALPTEDEAILLLQVNFIGAIEFDRKRIWFFASLFESRVLTLTIDGELGLLVAYGDEPNFVLTVGGFHPAFVAPALPFPMPKRVAINILNTDNARIAVSGYFAVTSNTAQFGAAAELYFGFSAFRVQGHIGFDALFRFSPFSFIIEVRASVSLKAFGVGLFSISLRFSLEGPTPWRARGTGSISLLFFEISADFDITWGEERDTTLPSIPVLPLLATEFAKPECWRTLAPSGGKPLVVLRVLPEAERDLVLHPLGTLFVVQRAVPLDLRLDKVGSQAVSDVSRCTVEVVSGGLKKRSAPEERFALAQFQNMDDAAKLSRPAFERQHAGVELGSDGTALASQRVARRSTRYEEIVIDPIIRQAPNPIIRQAPKSRRLTTYNTTLFKHFLRGSSVSRSPLSSAEAALRQPYAETIKVTGDTYAIASTRDNTAAGPTFTSYAQARDYLDDQLAEDPSVADSLHIIPLIEVAA